MQTIRREALDNFIIVSERQLKNILTEYVSYYNTMRPHHGIGLAIPSGGPPVSEGEIVSKEILGGLHHHYYRKAS